MRIAWRPKSVFRRKTSKDICARRGISSRRSKARFFDFLGFLGQLIKKGRGTILSSHGLFNFSQLSSGQTLNHFGSSWQFPQFWVMVLPSLLLCSSSWQRKQPYLVSAYL